ncbi:MAG: hypothetical protein HWE27_19115 [Gammaproteobacteria bacterium]|nr:hypothetical protein [Gammaproteobacteria bacterium]
MTKLLSQLLIALTIMVTTSLQINASPLTKEQTFEDDWGDSWDDQGEKLVYGFVEVAKGSFLDPFNLKDAPLEEIRWRIEWDQSVDDVKFTLKSDLLYDKYLSSSNLTARFREANTQYTISHSLDIKVGRQILTWGTGDYVFINDLFPKDWQSFFNGRDDEYLKAPSDAIRVTYFNEVANIDFVVTPEFDSDNYLSGERFSFWQPDSGIVQPNPPIQASKPDNDYEVAFRVFDTLEGIEWAFYGYRGFYKSPNGANSEGHVIFPRLNSLGASIRSPFFKGLLNVEIGQYKSVDDSNGDNPLLPNSQNRFLIGYEQELLKNLNGSIQYYVEKTSDYETMLANSFFPQQERNETYDLITLRLTHQAFQQKLTSSFFLFYSPEESDWHYRLKADYRMTDSWNLSAGIYRFNGKDPYTFWSQLQNNDSVWIRVRYNY